MAQTIQFKRGTEASLPSTGLAGEPLFCTDSYKLFIGTGSGRQQVVGTDELVKVGAAGTPDYLNDSYFEQDGTNHIRIKQSTVLTGVNADKVDGTDVNDSGTSTSDLWTASKIKSYVDGLVNGLDWQNSVLDKDLATPPGSPSTGDRYIVGTSGTGDWSGKDGQIAEYNGTSWDFYVPNEGFAVRVEDEDTQYVHNGSAWVKFGTTTAHNETSGLQGGTSGEYYHLTSAQNSGLTSGGATTLHKHNLDNLDEGTTNLFFTDERAQDAVAGMMTDSDTITWTYTDASNTLSADVNVDGTSITIDTANDYIQVAAIDGGTF